MCWHLFEHCFDSMYVYVLQDQEALKDFEVRMVTLELRANRDLQDPVVLLAHKETLASLACLVLPE